MGATWSRRDVLRTFALTAGVPALRPGSLQGRRVGIVGGGMAGVSLAWLLDGARDVVVLEARDEIGGNIRSVEVDVDGHPLVVDMGAQFFHPGPYPAYTALLTYLGLYPPTSGVPGSSHSFPASITVAAGTEPLPRFVSPVLPDRSWPLLSPWNSAGVAAFGTAFLAAKIREQLHGSWTLTLGEWLPTLGLSRAQWEGMLLPWAASLFSGSIDQARGLSARAAMIFAAKALPANLWEPVVYYIVDRGMAEVLRRLLDQCSTVQVWTGARVRDVEREPLGTFTLHCDDGRSVTVDDLVLASSGPASLRLLEGIPDTAPQQSALRSIEFHDARLALHTDPVYVPPNPFFWSFLNCQIEGPYCEASMWMAPVLAGAPATSTGKLWKSWVTHRSHQPAHVLHQVEFRHMLPTVSTLIAQAALRAMQGRDGIWFAGGYTWPYDSQETALLSALGVALGLGAATSGRVGIVSDRV